MALDSEPIAEDLGKLILRVGAGGAMFWQHGLPKLMHFTDKMDHFGDPIGVGSTLSLVLILLAEVPCALLVALGLWTRATTVPLIIGMGVAAFVSNGGKPFAEMELAVCYLLAFITIFFVGSGRFAINRISFS